MTRERDIVETTTRAWGSAFIEAVRLWRSAFIEAVNLLARVEAEKEALRALAGEMARYLDTTCERPACAGCEAGRSCSLKTLRERMRRAGLLGPAQREEVP